MNLPIGGLISSTSHPAFSIRHQSPTSDHLPNPQIPATTFQNRRYQTSPLLPPLDPMSFVSRRLAGATPFRHSLISKKLVPPAPPYFAMYMQLKDLQRSVGDRYANKGLSREVGACRFFLGWGAGCSSRSPNVSHSCILIVLFLQCFPAFLRLDLPKSPLLRFSHHQKVHYNALFVKIRLQHAL
jgi:hypothetical protein